MISVNTGHGLVARAFYDLAGSRLESLCGIVIETAQAFQLFSKFGIEVGRWRVGSLS